MHSELDLGTKTTISHEEIRHWAESRDAKPARVKDLDPETAPEALRFYFTDESSLEPLEIISWDDFLRYFDHNNLALQYQEENLEGNPSRVYELVSRYDLAQQAAATGAVDQVDR